MRGELEFYEITKPTIEREVEWTLGDGFYALLYFWSDGVVTWKKER